MKRLTFKTWLLLFILVAALLVPAASAWAQGPVIGDKVIFGGRFDLHSGQTLQGDLVIFGGTAQIAQESIVTGDVAVIGGTAQVDGEIRGDVAVVGGSLILGPTAVVDGDAVNFGGSFSRDPGAVVRGNVVSGFRFEGLEDGAEVTIPGAPPIEIRPDQGPDIQIEPLQPRGFGDVLLEYFLRGLAAVAWATILAVFGVLLLLIAPRPTERVVKAATENPLLALLAGLIAQVLGIAMVAILAITICLTPFAVVLGLALVIGWFFGWLALGWYLGKRLLVAARVREATLVLEAAAGVAILTLLWRMPLAVPFIGWLVFWAIGLIVGWIGLGGVVLTRFGSRPYIPSGARSSAPLAPAGTHPPAPLPLPEEEIDFHLSQEDEDLPPAAGA